VLFCLELKNVDVICLTEHRQSDYKLNCTNIVDFKLVSAFCSSNERGVGYAVAQLVETLRYKPDGSGFDSSLLRDAERGCAEW
jgi:hypothetical protein